MEKLSQNVTRTEDGAKATVASGGWPDSLCTKRSMRPDDTEAGGADGQMTTVTNGACSQMTTVTNGADGQMTTVASGGDGQMTTVTNGAADR